MPPFVPAFLSGIGITAFLPVLIIFAAAKLLGEAAERLKQPSVVGELAAGIIVGPAVLGWVSPGGAISFLAELGVLFLMFQVGLELKDFGLRKLGATALSVAVGGVVLPFIAGYYLTRSFGYQSTASSFVGAAMVATSVGITARVLASQGWLDESASKIILAAAIIDDVLGLIVLSAVSGKTRDGMFIVEFLAAAALAVSFAVATWRQRAMVRVPPRIKTKMSGTGKFTLSVILLLSLALMAEHIGVAAIIGAFLAGMAMANSADRHVQGLVHGATELLVPFFLAGIGLHLEKAALVNPSLWPFFGALAVAACFTKFIGCSLPALRMGRKDAARVGIGMMPRGEVGMVVAQVGLALQAISSEIYAAVVVLAVASTIVAPPLLKWAYRMESYQGEPLQLRGVG